MQPAPLGGGRFERSSAEPRRRLPDHLSSASRSAKTRREAPTAVSAPCAPATTIRLFWPPALADVRRGRQWPRRATWRRAPRRADRCRTAGRACGAQVRELTLQMSAAPVCATVSCVWAESPLAREPRRPRARCPPSSVRARPSCALERVELEGRRRRARLQRAGAGLQPRAAPTAARSRRPRARPERTRAGAACENGCETRRIARRMRFHEAGTVATSAHVCAS